MSISERIEAQCISSGIVSAELADYCHYAPLGIMCITWLNNKPKVEIVVIRGGRIDPSSSKQFFCNELVSRDSEMWVSYAQLVKEKKLSQLEIKEFLYKRWEEKFEVVAPNVYYDVSSINNILRSRISSLFDPVPEVETATSKYMQERLCKIVNDLLTATNLTTFRLKVSMSMKYLNYVTIFAQMCSDVLLEGRELKENAAPWLRGTISRF